MIGSAATSRLCDAVEVAIDCVPEAGVENPLAAAGSRAIESN
jgi:hypothetical protein